MTTMTPPTLPVPDEKTKKMLSKQVFLDDKKVIEWVKSAGSDLYKRMDLEKDCKKDDFEKQFRKMGPLVHKANSQNADAPATFKAILQAFLILGDDNNRKNYDEKGMEGVAMDKLANADVADVSDVLTKGKNLSMEFMTPALRRISTCGDQLYTILGLDESKGKTYTMDDINKGFEDTSEGLELDLDNVMLYSDALNKCCLAFSILSDPEEKAKYDAGQIKVDERFDPTDIAGTKVMNGLHQRMNKPKPKEDTVPGVPGSDEEFARLLDSLTPGGYAGYKKSDDVPQEATSTEPKTPWYKDSRLFLFGGGFLLYVGMIWQVARMNIQEDAEMTSEQAMHYTT